MNHEEPLKVDFSQFWVHLRRSDGKVTTAPLFDSVAFQEMFGEEAASAFGNYEHFRSNPPNTPVGKQMQRDAIATLSVKGLDPELIHDAHKSAIIEDA